MNNGKICVSVFAETADELINQINRAENLADVIEIRFDYLNEDEIKPLLEKLSGIKKQKLYLFTFRAGEQGGKRKLTFGDREDFWNDPNLSAIADLIDNEEDITIRNSSKLIKSSHDFAGVPGDLEDLFERLRSTNADIVKIAVQANDITDAIPLWKILERAKAENVPIIPIAMGESGKWTRILGLSRGAFLTFASLNSDSATAPGQVTAQEMTDVYRVKELNEATETYGILGSNTSVSMSPFIHNTAFKFHNLNSVFVPLQVLDLDDFITRMVKPETREIDLNFKGFSVTIPHKQNIIKHLDYIDETAEKIGAVNTVKIIDGKLYGYNTDAKGFIEPLKQVYGDLSLIKVGVLGAGGAARACIYALLKEHAEVTIFARDIAKSNDLTDAFGVGIKQIETADFADFDIVVNSTPLGMKGKAEGISPVSAEQLKGVKLAYDLVYIPPIDQIHQRSSKH